MLGGTSLDRVVAYESMLTPPRRNQGRSGIERRTCRLQLSSDSIRTISVHQKRFAQFLINNFGTSSIAPPLSCNNAVTRLWKTFQSVGLYQQAKINDVSTENSVITQEFDSLATHFVLCKNCYRRRYKQVFKMCLELVNCFYDFNVFSVT